MPLNFQVVPTKDLGGGEDAKSAPSSILAGYCESLLNVETNSSGWIGTRKGYQGYFGWVPVRVSEVIHSGTSIRFRVGSTDLVNLTDIGTMPLVVYGKLPAADAPGGGYAGDFSTTDALRYYPFFTSDNRQTLTAPSGTLSLDADDHGMDTYRMFVQLAKATGGADLSHTLMTSDEVSINQTTFDVSVDYSTPTSELGYLYFLECAATTGETHIESVVAETSVAITAGTHALDNYNILVKCFDTTSGASVEVVPDSVSITTTGTVTVTFADAFTGEIILRAAESSNVATGSAVAGSNTITVTGVTSPWVFVSVYAYDSVTSSYVQVVPGTTSFDASAGTISIDYSLASGSESVEVYYTYGNVVSNSLSVTDTGAVSESYSSTNPQITIWGLPHADIYYTEESDAGGHVTHIDTYRRTDESRAICALGGTVYAARTLDEVGSTYGMPEFSANLRSRVDGDTVLAPLFHEDGSSVARTRGIVTDSSIESNLARVTAATYVSAGVIDYTLTFTSKTGSVAIGSTVAATDYLTVSGLSHGAYNGSFQISSVVSDTATQTVIRCTNSDAFVSDFDETGADGRAGVFSDKFTVTTTPSLLAGDSVLSSAISTSLDLTVLSNATTAVTVTGVTGDVSLPSGVLIFYERDAAVVPLRDAALSSTVTNLIRGDMLEVTDLDRQVRVLNVNVDDDNTVTDISVSASAATVTLASPHHLRVGQKILLVNTGVAAFDGEQTIASIPSTTTLTFTTTSSGSSSTGTLVGNTAELDETLTVRDGATTQTDFSVAGRWIPVEIPTSEYDLPATTKTQLFNARDFANQDVIRSTIIADTMYFTNGDDEVFKFDGSSVYQAGLIPWQPQLFVQVDTTTGSITIDTTEAASSAWASNKFTLTLGEGAGFNVGDRIQRSTENDIFTILKITDDGTNDFIYVDRAISGATAARTLTKVARFRYYFRLNMIDANNNMVASAATGASDFLVELADAAQVRLRLVGVPAVGVYDFDRVELQVYRTQANAAGPFYLVRTVPVNFDAASGYIDVTDGTPDELLQDFDPINTALLGAEVGTAWHPALRAKYITSAANKLILANIKDYPEINAVIRRKSSSAALTTSDLSGFTWTFRKDNTDAGTSTNNVDRAVYEFVTSGAVTIDPATDLARDATTFTITENAHGLVVGDWVYLFHSAAGNDKDLHFAGWFQVSAKDTNTFTVNFPNGYTPGATDVDRYVCATTKSNIPVWLGTDGNYNFVDANPSTSYEFTAALRLANAINAVAAMTDRTISGQEDFQPWMLARAGSEYSAGQIVIRQPTVESTTLELALPTIASTAPYQIFVNNVVRSSTQQISATQRLFPSRVLVSYDGYPEIFDDPFGNSGDGDSAVDINAADGQEVAGALPFFGQSSFGSGQTESKVIVLKTNSLYQLDVATLKYQEIKQPYGGCTAPRSITQTKDGIMFANESGIYRLNNDLTVTPVGEFEQRRWRREVNQDRLSVATGHNFLNGNQYKLSVPIGAGQETNNYVFVYDYTREGQGRPYGAWTRHTNFNATGWANLGKESLFGTIDGQVHKIRNANDVTDYRDDAAAISMSITTRLEDFDLPDVNKIVSGVCVTFHNDSAAVTGATVSTAVDGETTFSAADTISIETSTKKVESAWFSPAKRKCDRVQTRIACSTIDSPIVVAGISYRVAGLDVKGTPEAVNL